MNTRFARLGEEVFKKQSDLTGEEFRLYCIIFFHSFFDSGICRKNLRQLTAIYSLSYTHTTERYKVLEKLRWVESAKKGMRPLVGLKVPQTGTSDAEMFRKPEHDSSANRNIDIPQTGTSDAEMFRKPELVYKEYKEPLKSEIYDSDTAADKTAAAAVETNGHKSIFSLEECLRYAEICLKRGEPIRSLHGLAVKAYQTGNDDVFIRAALYPEPGDEITAPTASSEISDERRQALEILTDLAASGEDISDMRQWYSAEVWSWLMEELGNG